MMLTCIRLRNQNPYVSGATLAQASLRVGQIIMAGSCLLLIGHVLLYPEYPCHVGAFLMVGVNGSIYSLLLYIFITLFEPLEKADSGGTAMPEMARVQFFWTHLGLLGFHVMVVLWAVGAF